MNLVRHHKNAFTFYAAGAQFRHSNVTMSAESVGGSTPGVRVTWSTTAPPECVVAVRVVFRHSAFGSEVTSYTTTNTSGTQVIQSRLQCAREYYVRVFVIAESQRLGGIQLHSNQQQVFVGGKQNCVHDISVGTSFLHTQCGWLCDENIGLQKPP